MWAIGVLIQHQSHHGWCSLILSPSTTTTTTLTTSNLARQPG